MTRYEFINKLKSALENDLNSNSVQEHINYYNDYISSEVRNGRSEADVITELGDPWAIAKTIISSEGSGSSSYEEYSYTSSDKGVSNSGTSSRTSGGPNVHVFGLNSWWKKLLVILGIIGVVMIVFSIVTGIISLIAPFVMPIIFITLVVRLIKKLKQK